MDNEASLQQIQPTYSIFKHVCIQLRPSSTLAHRLTIRNKLYYCPITKIYMDGMATVMMSVLVCLQHSLKFHLPSSFYASFTNHGYFQANGVELHKD